MIYVTRDRVAKPAHLSSKAAEEAETLRSQTFVQPASVRGQKRFEFDESIWLHPEVVEALGLLFAGKCAYCETPLSEDDSGVVDHFRPRTDALDLDQRATPDHYAWLAYAWENLYLACRICSLNKGVQFPVAGRRAPADSVGADLRRDERALLLDPCQDRIGRHLVFQDDGTVDAVRRRSGRDLRGRITIKILGLNRRELVDRRQALAERVMKLLRRALDPEQGLEAQKRAARELRNLSERRRPFAGSVRQVYERRLRGAGDALRKSRVRGELEELAKRIREAARGAPEERVHELAEPEELDEGAVSATPTAYLDWVEIQNFRAIHKLELGFFPRDDRAGWKVLLGENGFGKSSVLQAIGLTLIGQEGVDALSLDPAKLLRRGARKGHVKVGLTTAHEPLELHLDRKKIRAKGGAARLAPLLLRGYGATRLLPPPGDDGPEGLKPGVRHWIRSLFNPYEPLLDAAGWLAGLPRSGFERASRTLGDLLDLRKREVLRRAKGRVRVHNLETRTRVELDQLSDGYQSVLAVAVDLMAGAPEGLHDLQNTPGIVLLDEIGAHLHPRWRMRIVSDLRRAFPKIQFLATTHEPLCLRGLKMGEIEVLRRDEKDRLRFETDLPSPEGLRIDQLLTSHLFGLYTTIDEAVERKFRRYYQLLAAPELGPDEKSQLHQLRSELSGYGVLGYTRRDQMVYDAIDDFLASEQESPREGYEMRWQETRQKVQDIWRWIDFKEAPKK